MIRKTSSFAILVFGLVSISSAQKGFYLGYENGYKWDNFNYANNAGNSLNQLSLGLMWGGYLGYKVKAYSVETGFYGFYTSSPFYNYNYEAAVATKSVGNHGSGMDNWVIPIRFGYEFLHRNEKLFIKTEMGAMLMIAKNFGLQSGIWSFSAGDSYDAMPALIEGYSSWTTGYRPSKYNYGFESNISIGYRIKKKLDIFMKAGLYTSFNTLYYELITHRSDYGVVEATHSFNGTSLSSQIGLCYYMGK